MIDLDKEIILYTKLLREGDDENKDFFMNEDIYSKLDNIVNNTDKMCKQNISTCKAMDKQLKISENLLENNHKINSYIDQIQDLKLRERIQLDRENNMIAGLINILDSISWLLETSMIFTNEGLKGSIDTTKKLIKRELEKIKIVEIASIGDLYNEDNHICIAYKKDNNLMDNQITEIIKNGYRFKDKIVRQAEVIVVNNSVEVSCEYNRD